MIPTVNFNELISYLPSGSDFAIYSIIILTALCASFEIFKWLADKIQRIFFPYPMTEYGFKGKIYYIDDSNEYSKIFLSNKRYIISAKPDVIYKIGLFRYLLVEFKSTTGRVSKSHINQAIAATLAVRTNSNGKKIPITEILVLTRSSGEGGRFYMKATSNSSLFKRISSEYKAVKKARRGHMFPIEAKKSCHGCPYKKSCGF